MFICREYSRCSVSKLLACITALCLTLGGTLSTTDSDVEDKELWPIFQSIHSSLHEKSSNDGWTVLPHSNPMTTMRRQKSRNVHVGHANRQYPQFLDDCQIPQLHLKYLELFGYIDNGTFVEVGASDGRRWSNTYQLAKIGWTGHYIEPVPQYAHICAVNHADHLDVKTHILAVGASRSTVNVHVGAALSTCSTEMLQVYSGLDWSAGYHSGEQVAAPLRTLNHFLAATGVPVGFEVLVIDVEGFESEVLQGFSALYWRPRVVIIEIEDTHESFQGIEFLQERYKGLRYYFERRGYIEYWRDHINTIFFLP